MLNESARRLRTRVLIAAAAALGLLSLAVPPVRELTGYHDFADQRAWLGIPNFANVASNLPFLLVAWLGALRVRHAPSALRAALGAAFLGIGLTCFGSSYYHWVPSPTSLFFDRLPMGVAFTALVATMLGDRVHAPLARRALAPLLLFGAFSVSYWAATGDLRFWALTQFGGLLLVLLILALFPGGNLRTRALLGATAFYGLAKMLELGDVAIYHALGETVSGHSLKHLAAAAGGYQLVRAVRLNA